jgi:hypothetical protein
MSRIIALLVLVFIIAGPSEISAQGMPKKFRKHIQDHMIGQWTAELTWGDEKSTGEHRMRWASNRSCVIEQITFTDKDGDANQTNLWGWDSLSEAMVVHGFSSRGDHFTIRFDKLADDKWTGHGKGTFAGKPWESAASIEWSKDSIKYEDTTDGKPFVLVTKRKPKE